MKLKKQISLFIATIIALSAFAGTTGLTSSTALEHNIHNNNASSFLEFENEQNSLADDAIIIGTSVVEDRRERNIYEDVSVDTWR